jgi:cytochrome c oxidase subunit III
MLLFVASEAFFFLALIVSYVYYSYPGGKLSDTASYLDFKRTALFSVFLFSSSFTIAMAENKIKNGNRNKVLPWLVATIILGMVFLVGQATEYIKLIDLNVTIHKNLFGSAFFTLTGFHGLHVLLGLIVLMVVAGLISSGKFKSIENSAFQSVSIYWHFVDIVWVAVFSVVYIGAII